MSAAPPRLGRRAIPASLCALLAGLTLGACGAPWDSADSGSRLKDVAAKGGVAGPGEGGTGSGEGSGGNGSSSPSASGDGAVAGALDGSTDGAGEETRLSSIPDFPWGQKVSPELRREAALVRRLVVEMIEMTNAGDPAICTRLFTRHHLENVTGETGAQAVAKCRSDIAASEGQRKIVAFESLRIDGLVSADEGQPTGHKLARVQFVTAENGKRDRHLLELLRADGPYKIYQALRPERSD